MVYFTTIQRNVKMKRKMEHGDGVGDENGEGHGEEEKMEAEI
jgi:hypothetical protein